MATPLISPVYYAWDPRTGAPLAGGKVYTYETGTSKPKATFTSQDARTYNTNPVILDSAGKAPIYLNGSYKIQVFAEDGYLVFEADPVTDVSRIAEEWIYPTDAIYVSGTEFKVSGSMVDIFVEGRALKLADATTIYGNVASSYYSGGFTFVEVVSSQSLTVALLSVAVGMISSDPLGVLDQNIAMAGGTRRNARGGAIYRANTATGGTNDALNYVDGASGGPIVNNAASALQDGDMAFVCSKDDTGGLDIYVMDEGANEEEAPPETVAPLTNAGERLWRRIFSLSGLKMYIDTAIATAKSESLQAVFPIGSYYTSETDSRNPNSILGFGTWSSVEGMAIVGYKEGDSLFGMAGAEVGSKDAVVVAHDHEADASSTTTVMINDPGHDHETMGQGDNRGAGERWTVTGYNTHRTYRNTTGITATATTETTITIRNYGVTGINKNVQPSRVAYIWRRTS